MAGGSRSVFGERSNVPAVKGYIENQEEHHRRLTVDVEFRELCKWH